VFIIAQALFYLIVATERSVVDGDATLRHNGALSTPKLAVLEVPLLKTLLLP
jgi:hypothetical protein